MFQNSRETLFLPDCIAETPDQLNLGFRAFRRDCLLKREESVIALYGLTSWRLRCSPGLPLILDVPVEVHRDFGVIL